MTLDTKKMHRDILRRLGSINKPQWYLTEKLNISRFTLHRLGQGKEITVKTMFILIEWLDKDINYYIKHNKNQHYGTNRAPNFSKTN